MKTEIMGTVINGSLKLDQPVPFADETRVAVTVQAAEDWRVQFRSGLDGLKRLIQERPICSGGLRYTREELHERR